jgi:hypothetical protein
MRGTTGHSCKIRIEKLSEIFKLLRSPRIDSKESILPGTYLGVWGEGVFSFAVFFLNGKAGKLGKLFSFLQLRETYLGTKHSPKAG